MPVRFNGVFKACHEMVLSILGASNAITGIVLVGCWKRLPQRRRVAVSGPMESLIGLYGLVWCSRSGHKVMKLQNIHLENQALNAFVTPFYHDVTHSSHAMSTYGSAASTASHFFTFPAAEWEEVSPARRRRRRLWTLVALRINSWSLFPFWFRRPGRS